MTFVLIPAGEFRMGSTDGDDDERPVHTVRISQPFYLGIHAVTQGQWEAVMGNNPSQFKGDPNRPVERVSWEDVQAFIDQPQCQRGAYAVSPANGGGVGVRRARRFDDGVLLWR